MTAFAFERHGRSIHAILILACVYAALIFAVVLIDAAWWLMALLALLTLPALRDVIADPAAGLRLDESGLEWFSGRRRGHAALTEIDKILLDTRWDLSVRATLLLHGGKRIRLPQESLPPHRQLEAEASHRGLTVERHHFSVF